MTRSEDRATPTPPLPPQCAQRSKGNPPSDGDLGSSCSRGFASKSPHSPMPAPAQVGPPAVQAGSCLRNPATWSLGHQTRRQIAAAPRPGLPHGRAAAASQTGTQDRSTSRNIWWCPGKGSRHACGATARLQRGLRAQTRSPTGRRSKRRWSSTPGKRTACAGRFPSPGARDRGPRRRSNPRPSSCTAESPRTPSPQKRGRRPCAAPLRRESSRLQSAAVWTREGVKSHPRCQTRGSVLLLRGRKLQSASTFAPRVTSPKRWSAAPEAPGAPLPPDR
mmetsp:Transcript_14350/g.54116  ORF Transcript_14350/g.54116 Transcript_14350/m.54116 type:complete len:277 (+) Transcript_14350:893-1723(+)